MFFSNLLLFASIIVVLALTPGPDVIYITTRGIAQGRTAALLSTVGICIGYLVYTMLAALGLSALLQSSVIAFDIIRYTGAIYLLYLGIRTLMSKAGDPLRLRAVNPVPAGRILQQGILTSMLNPKGILVFAALLPQFVNPHLVLHSLKAITKETPTVTRRLGRASPHPGFGSQIELSGRDTGGLFNLLGVSKALSSQRITPEEAPPTLL